MRGCTTVSIYNNFTPGQAGIAIRPADDKLAGRVHVPLGFRRDPALGHHFQNIGRYNIADILRALLLGGVLGG